MISEGRPLHVALIGFGEAGRAFAAGWRGRPAVALRAHDAKAADPREAPAIREAAARLGVVCHADPAGALADAGVAFCLVTADQALAAAEAAAPHLPAGLLWLDGNSCAPGTKRRAADVISAAGARYVDMAIMAPVHPALHRTPSLLSGPDAEAAVTALAGLGMVLRLTGDRIGQASSIKMLRSVMMKGLEALTAECLLAARRAGVEGDVLASLQASDPGWDWRRRGGYSLERMLVHGNRRSAEMREVALTLRELGLPDRMASATAAWEAELGALALGETPEDLGARLDAILAALA
jgi:3-hydroxyisobutyrate dehydrogenase-like beta-hydroxyacid dehydrogenase